MVQAHPANAAAAPDDDLRAARSVAMLEAMLEALRDDGVLTLGMDGRIDSWPASAARLTGLLEHETLGKPLGLIAASGGTAEADAAVDAARANGWFEGQFQISRKTGVPFRARAYLRRIDAAGTPVGFVLVLHDLTEHLRIEEKLRELGASDPLTGAYNRRYFFEVAGYEVRRWRRYRHPLSFILMDVDQLAGVNERFGQAIGDMVLQHIVAVCREYVRGVDVLGRLYAGTFALMLPQTGLEGARILGDRLRKAIETAPLRAGGTQVQVTVSVGVLEVADTSMDIDDLIEATELLVEKAKASGRNRLMSTGDSDA